MGRAERAQEVKLQAVFAEHERGVCVKAQRLRRRIKARQLLRL